LVTHLADEVAILDAGTIVAAGALELVADSMLAERHYTTAAGNGHSVNLR
jgi:hypothetical protein